MAGSSARTSGAITTNQTRTSERGIERIRSLSRTNARAARHDSTVAVDARGVRRAEIARDHRTLTHSVGQASFMPYLWVFLASLAVDLVPVFGPPAWTAMVLI